MATISTYALISAAELQDEIVRTGSAESDRIIYAVNRASSAIETWLDRQIVTRGSLTEYSVRGGCSILRLTQWPIITITSVHETTDWPRSYGADELLVVSTDYEQVGPDKLRRLTENGPPTTWAAGSRAVRVVYSAGYATTATVPDALKTVCRALAALYYRESDRAMHGVSSQTDGLGSVTRFVPATLTQPMKDELMPWRRFDFAPDMEAAA